MDKAELIRCLEQLLDDVKNAEDIRDPGVTVNRYYRDVDSGSGHVKSEPAGWVSVELSVGLFRPEFGDRPSPRVAPWLDFKGAAVFQGDLLQHPDGSRGQVVFLSEYLEPADQWRVKYDDGDLLRLCLQVGDKGQAAICDRSHVGD